MKLAKTGNEHQIKTLFLGAAAAMLALAVLATGFFGVLAHATEVGAGENGGYAYYTNQQGVFTLPVQGPLTGGETAAVFQKDEATGEYRYLSEVTQKLGEDGKTLELTLPDAGWTEDDPAPYCAAVTELEKDTLARLTVGTESGEGMLLSDPEGETELEARPIRVIYDATAPAAEDCFDFTMLVSGNESAGFANVGDTVSVSFRVKEGVVPGSAILAGVPVSLKQTDGLWEFSLELPTDTSDFYLGKPLDFSIALADFAGNSGTVISSDFAGVKPPVYRGEAPRATGVSLSPAGGYAKAGEIVTLSLAYNKPVTVTPPQGWAVQGGETAPSANWALTYAVTEQSKNGPLAFSVSAEDESGNTLAVTQENAADTVIIDTIAPVLTLQSFSSSNADDAKFIQKSGTVTLRFTCGEELAKLPQASFWYTYNDEAEAAFPIEVRKNGAGYEAVFSISDWEHKPNSDSAEIHFKMTAGDAAGNAVVLESGGDDVLRYSRKVITPSQFKSISLAVQSGANTKPVDGNTVWVKQGDTVLLDFLMSGTEELSDKNWNWGKSSSCIVTYGSKVYTILLTKDSGENRYTASWTVPGGLSSDQELKLTLSLRPKWGGHTNVDLNRQDFPALPALQYLAPFSGQPGISSSNQDSTLAKAGDTMKLRFLQPEEARHDVTFTGATLAGKDVTFQKKSNGEWEAAATADSALLGDCDQARVPFAFTVADKAGNSASYTEAGSPFVLYYSAIESGVKGSLQITKENAAAGDTAVKAGDTVRISFTAPHAITVENARVAGQAASFQLVKTQSGAQTWQALYTMRGDELRDGETLPFSFTAKDAAGNSANAAQSDAPGGITYFGPIEIKGAQLISSNQNPQLARDGDTVTVSFTVPHAVTVQYAFAAGQELVLQDLGGGCSFSGTYTLKNGDVADNAAVPLDISVRDAAGNQSSLTQEEAGAVTYFAPIKEGFSGLSLQNPGNPAQGFAKAGDTVFLSFSTTHPVRAQAELAGKAVTLESEDGMHWQGSCTLERGDVADNTDIPFTLSLTDEPGNDPLEKTQADASPVRYQAPLEDSLSSFSFLSDNTNTAYAKNGNTVTVQFAVSHPVAVTGAKIAGREVEFVNEKNDGMNWTATFFVQDGILLDNTDIPFTFSLNDEAGNQPLRQTQDNTAPVRYQAPIVIHGLSMVSNNEKSGAAFAKNGDRITVSFTTTHPVLLSDAKIAGTDAVFASEQNDGMNWKATYTVQDGQTPDMTAIALSLTAADLAGNAPVTATHNTLETPRVTYYAPLAITGTVLSTSNENDGVRYARDGDMVTVRFTASHACDLSNVLLAGRRPQTQSVRQAAGNAWDWTLSYALQNGDVADLQAVTFAFTVGDAAGNPAINKTNTDADVVNSIQYFAPITAQTTIAATGTRPQYARNNDNVTLTVKAGHEVSAVSASISGRQATVSGNESRELALTYHIPGGEGALAEGLLPFHYEITDRAGNRLAVSETSDNSQVVYDRTSPAVSLAPDFSGFTNETIAYTVVFEDTNLSAQDASFTVNGQEQLTAADRAAISAGAKSFRKTISLDSENEYKISASALDLADNASQSNLGASVTVDKTNPKVTAVSINMGEAGIFQSGFLIGDYFKIEEKYVKEVICIVTDSDGVHDWTVDTPIVTDGKKTVYLLVTDMAGNTSAAVTYDLYIDGTAPRLAVTDALSGRELSPGGNSDPFLSVMTLSARLEALHMGGEQPDRFAELKLLDANGQLVRDLLQDPAGEDGSYSYKLEAFGNYTLRAVAVDSVGNRTEAEYPFSFQNKSLFVQYVENKPLLYSTAAGGVVLVGGGAAGAVLFRRRRKRLAALKKEA